MNEVLEIIDLVSFPIQFSVSSVLLMSQLRKRTDFPIRVVLGLIAQMVVMHIAFLVFPFLAVVPISYFVLYFLEILFFLGCCEITFWEALFGATCANAIQHLGYVIFSFFDLILDLGEVARIIISNSIFVVSSAFIYIFLIKRMTIDGSFGSGPKEALKIVVIILPFALTLNILSDRFYNPEAEGSLELLLIIRIYAAACCIYVLWLQTSIKQRMHAEMELYAQKLLVRQQSEHYELSRGNIDLINQKSHDLKHQINALRRMQNNDEVNKYLEEMEQAVMIYDSEVETGNTALDIILTERSISCKKENISWTCMADGSLLNFMDQIDLYTLFGNALNNAVEAVSNIEDPNMRTISLTLCRRGEFALLQVENYYSGDIQLKDGLPETTKDDHNMHGFGMKSIRRTVEKYGGSISVDIDNNIFLLSIMLPIPS